MVVHGHGGMDELSLSGTNMACILKNGTLEELEITPEDAGLSQVETGYAEGGTAEENCRIIEGIFAGRRGAHRDVVIFNAAAALLTAGRADSLKEGAHIAGEVIDSGLAAAKLREVAIFACSRQRGAA